MEHDAACCKEQVAARCKKQVAVQCCMPSGGKIISALGGSALFCSFFFVACSLLVKAHHKVSAPLVVSDVAESAECVAGDNDMPKSKVY